MLNLLGDVWYGDAGAPAEPDWTRVLRHPEAKLHLYGKSEARRGRKMGHVTVLGGTAAECASVAATIERDLGIAT
jgi:5-(carboxyamino)imidazole ribonucleotide synthase